MSDLLSGSKILPARSSFYTRSRLCKDQTPHTRPSIYSRRTPKPPNSPLSAGPDVARVQREVTPNPDKPVQVRAEVTCATCVTWMSSFSRARSDLMTHSSALGFVVIVIINHERIFIELSLHTCSLSADK